ncbi:hypothetical protein [Paenibacillus luteus]|uniref:hypothetical protein n=1 Tax=Paenibacillus luteus TaxID=2545753 RepID=UPI00114246ED|nr:hypothetical protein [Paenibacillus luteus]
MKEGEELRKMVLSISVMFLIFSFLGACSTSPPAALDPAAIDAALTTDPDKPVNGSKIVLTAEFTGAKLSNSSGMTFEIRVDGEPVFIEAKKEGENLFSGIYTFAKSGTYEVYLHLYTEEIHLTKKKQVEVQ